MNKLKEAIISITNRCNLKCRMCDIPHNKKEELGASKWKEIITDISLLGAETIVFSGGEPLLREDLLELICFSKGKGLKVCITSNGRLIDEEKAAELSNAKVDVVNISLDGPKEIHDFLRGENSFEKTISALDNLKKNGIETTIATMVCSYNYLHLPQVVHLAAKYGATTIKFQPFNILFLKEPKDAGFFLLPLKDKEKMESIVKDAIGLCNSYGIATNPRMYLESFASFLTKGLKLRSNYCPALYSSLPINCKGEFYPCWVLTEKNRLIGDLSKEKLTDVWASGKHKRIIRAIEGKGCEGCLMSCYDHNLGGSQIKDKIVRNVATVRRNGLKFFVMKKCKQVYDRVIFYRSYRGSIRKIVKRLLRLIKRKSQHSKILTAVDNTEILNEIQAAKNLLKREIKNK